MLNHSKSESVRYSSPHCIQIPTIFFTCHLVCLQDSPSALGGSEGDVEEVVIGPELTKRLHHVTLVVVPPEPEYIRVRFELGIEGLEIAFVTEDRFLVLFFNLVVILDISGAGFTMILNKVDFFLGDQSGFEGVNVIDVIGEFQKSEKSH